MNNHWQLPVWLQSQMSGPAALLMVAPLRSEAYCQWPMPAYHPQSELARKAHWPSAVESTHPVLVASLTKMGFTTTSLLMGTPRVLIQETEVPLKVLPEALTKSSVQLLYWESPWLQNWIRQKFIRLPTCLSTVMQPPFLQQLLLKQGAWGQCVTILSGMTALRAWVNLMSQSSPMPFSIAALSYQSMSAPSRLFARTKLPSLVPHMTGSSQQVVGNSVAPKALTIILMPASLQIFFIPNCTTESLLPQGLFSPTYMEMFCQTRATSSGLLLQLQKAKIMQLQSWRVAQPGRPRLAATFMPYQQIMRSMQTARTGQLFADSEATVYPCLCRLKAAVLASRKATASRSFIINLMEINDRNQF